MAICTVIITISYIIFVAALNTHAINLPHVILTGGVYPTGVAYRYTV